MTEQAFEDFLQAFDLLAMSALSTGISPSALAGAVLARAQHLYLADGSADVDGLVRLLQYSIDNLNARPSWEIV